MHSEVTGGTDKHAIHFYFCLVLIVLTERLIYIVYALECFIISKCARVSLRKSACDIRNIYKKSEKKNYVSDDRLPAVNKEAGAISNFRKIKYKQKNI